MDIRVTGSKLTSICKKYRYPLFILLIGLILMTIPSKTQHKASNDAHLTESLPKESLESRLSTILSQMEGAGKVEVILTRSVGEEVIYQTNQDNSQNDASSSSKYNTVTVTDAERNQTGLIRQIIPEQYMGAIILCQGADDPIVCLSIVNAVSKATGLGANKISVLKMK